MSPKTHWMTCSPTRRSRAQVQRGGRFWGRGRGGCGNSLSLGPSGHQKQ